MKDLPPSSESGLSKAQSPKRPEFETGQPADFGMMMRRPEDLDRIPESFKRRLES